MYNGQSVIIGLMFNLIRVFASFYIFNNIDIDNFIIKIFWKASLCELFVMVPMSFFSDVVKFIYTKQQYRSLISVSISWSASNLKPDISGCCIVLIMTSFPDDMSALVQVMAWCRQATSHYLNQCWPRSPMPYELTYLPLDKMATILVDNIF